MVSVSRSGPCIMVLFCQSCPNITVTLPALPSPPASPACRQSCGGRVSLQHPFNLPSASQQACSYNTGLRWCANPLSSPDPLKAGAIRETAVKSLPAAVTAELSPPGVGVDRSETGRWVGGWPHALLGFHAGAQSRLSFKEPTILKNYVGAGWFRTSPMCVRCLPSEPEQRVIALMKRGGGGGRGCWGRHGGRK